MAEDSLNKTICLIRSKQIFLTFLLVTEHLFVFNFSLNKSSVHHDTMKYRTSIKSRRFKVSNGLSNKNLDSSWYVYLDHYIDNYILNLKYKNNVCNLMIKVLTRFFCISRYLKVDVYWLALLMLMIYILCFLDFTMLVERVTVWSRNNLNVLAAKTH